MLTPNFLRDITDGTTAATSKLNDYLTGRVIKRIIARLKKDKDIVLIPSSISDVKKIAESGKVYDEIAEEIAKKLPGVEQEVLVAFKNAESEINAGNAKKTAQILGEDATEADIEQSAKLTPKERKLIERAYNATNNEIRNLTRTTASDWQTEYIRLCDEAYWKASHGVSMNHAIKEAIDECSNYGSHVVYPSGHKDTIEVAIARAVRTGINQAAGDVSLARCAESGCEHVVVSSHIGARTTSKAEPANHASWQGQVYKLNWKNDLLAKYKPDIQEEQEAEKKGFSGLFGKLKGKFQKILGKGKKKAETNYPDFITVTGYGTGAGLCGWNCRHSFDIFYPGINVNNQRQYSKEENQKAYELSQMQRKQERDIRKTRHNINALKDALENVEDPKLKKDLSDDLALKKGKLDKQRKMYEQFCKKNNLRSMEERLYVAKFNGVPNNDNWFQNGTGSNALLE